MTADANPHTVSNRLLSFHPRFKIKYSLDMVKEAKFVPDPTMERPILKTEPRYSPVKPSVRTIDLRASQILL